jgi:hypothetical protein
MMGIMKMQAKKRTIASRYLFGLALVTSVGTAHADLNDMMQASAPVGSNYSSGGSFSDSFLQDLSISDMTMVMGPAINNLGAQQPSTPATATGSPPASGSGHHHGGGSAGAGTSSASAGGGGKGDGYSLRHLISFGYSLNNRLVLSPILDLGQPISGANSGSLSLNDPQLKLAFREILNQDYGKQELRSGLAMTYYAPVSDLSKLHHSQGAFQVGLSPKLQFKDSRYSLGGNLSLKSGFYQTELHNELVSSRVNMGIQQNYDLSDATQAYFMCHSEVSIGPKVAMADPGIVTSSNSHSSRLFGLMTGLRFQASKTLSFAPRLNWYTDQPIQTTSVGLNIFIKLI